MFLPGPDDWLQSEEINPTIMLLRCPKHSPEAFLFFSDRPKKDKMLRMTKCSWETLCWETMVTKSHRAAPPLSLCTEWTLLLFAEHKQRRSRKDASLAEAPLILPTCCHWLSRYDWTLTHSLTHSARLLQRPLQLFFVSVSVFVFFSHSDIHSTHFRFQVLILYAMLTDSSHILR